MPETVRDRLVARGARFTSIVGVERVESFGDVETEYRTIRNAAGLIDQSFRGKLRVTGRDRVDFLQGMVTNDISKLSKGQGAYAVFPTIKGKMLADARIYCLAESLFIDLEPHTVDAVIKHLDKYIIASDVVLADETDKLALFSLYGPAAETVLASTFGTTDLPAEELRTIVVTDQNDLILACRNGITGYPGFDLFVAVSSAAALYDRILKSGGEAGVRPAGFTALETARMEASQPRYGVDMDETNFPMEAGLENAAISFTKGCYLGQEVIARASTQGRMNRLLVGLELDGDEIPEKGQAILVEDQEVGKVTGGVRSPRLNRVIALGYVRAEWAKTKQSVQVRSKTGDRAASVRELPFFPPGA